MIAGSDSARLGTMVARSKVSEMTRMCLLWDRDWFRWVGITRLDRKIVERCYVKLGRLPMGKLLRLSDATTLME